MKKFLVLLIFVLSLTGCTLPGLGGDACHNDIVIAGGATTERQIMAEMLVQMSEHYLPEVNVSTINNLGSTLLIVQALTRRDANVSAIMYTGTSITGELGLEPITNPEKALTTVIEEYNKKYDMVWFPSYGFTNTYAFMMSREVAEKEHIKTISDLKRLAPTLRAGVDTAWIDRKGDGYEDFKREYGFDFGKVMPMEIGLVYNAVHAREMDVVLGYSTDGRIDSYDLVVLEDDRHLFPDYDASPVVAKELLERYPELETVILKLEGQISTEMMQRLNQEADELKLEPQEVARKFLQDHDYFKNVQVVPLNERSLYQDIVGGIKP